MILINILICVVNLIFNISFKKLKNLNTENFAIDSNV